MWTKLQRTERATIGPFQIHVWELVAGKTEGARYAVWNPSTGKYIKEGQCASLDWAKEVSANFVRSLINLVA